MPRASEFTQEIADIYALCDAASGEVRYIGKARNPQKRLAGHMRECRRRNTPLYAWLRKHGAPKIIILEAGCPDWRESERRHIAAARNSGVRLLNIADGGDEPYCSTEVRRTNAFSAIRKRPKNIMRAYRIMESNIRSLSRLGATEAAARLRVKLAAVIDAVDNARLDGRLHAVDRRVGEFLNGSAGR